MPPKVVDEEFLLSDESVVCGVKSEGRDERGAQKVLLTNGGWLALISPHNFEGLTKMHRILKLVDIDSVRLEKEGQTSIMRAILMLFLLMPLLFVTFYLVIEEEARTSLWKTRQPTYYVCDDGQELDFQSWSDNEVSCDDGSGEFSDLEGVVFVIIWLFPVWLWMLMKHLQSKGVHWAFILDRDVLIITHSNGVMGVSTSSSNLHEAWIAYFGTTVGLVGIAAIGGLSTIFNPDLLAPAAIIALAFVLYRSLKAKEEESDEEELAEIDYAPIEEFHRNLLIALGLTGDESGGQEIRPLEQTMGDELSSIRERLEEHDEILSQIVAHYPDIFSVPAPYLGITLIRTSTEILLAHRLRQILPNPSKGLRSLSNYRDQLRKHDAGVEPETLRSIDVVISLGNDAVHSMEATKEDYVSALRRFVAIVDWHLSTPPQSITGS